MPTYEDFMKDLQKSGVTMSNYDLDVAKNNPNYGYYMMNKKLDYAKATTDEARALINSEAEAERKKYGFTAGADGSGYNPVSTTPTSTGLFDQYFGGKYNDRNGYDATYNDLLGQIMNYGKFEYDPSTDPLYGIYKDQYTRNGQMAMQDTLGQMAARTGGLASSYAGTAAQQSFNNYMDALSAKIPELYQQKYNEWSDGYNRLLSGLGAVGDARNIDYGRYQDEQAQLLNALNIVRADEQNAAKALRGGGGKLAADDAPVDTTPIPSALWSQMVSLAGSDKSAAASYIDQYWDRMTAEQRNTMIAKLGVPYTQRGSITSKSDALAAAGLYNPQSNSTPQITAPTEPLKKADINDVMTRAKAYSLNGNNEMAFKYIVSNVPDSQLSEVLGSVSNSAFGFNQWLKANGYLN